jgi:hypothetical protein
LARAADVEELPLLFIGVQQELNILGVEEECDSGNIVIVEW